MSVLDVDRVHAGYGKVSVLRDVSLHVDDGEVVVLLGANGAGKTTLLRAISGLVAATGSIRCLGHELIGLEPHQVPRLGVAHVPQGRGTFPDLSVLDNLRIGALSRTEPGESEDIEHWFEVFPKLGERRLQAAGQLSGGEQQMLAIARALMSKPQLLLLDEPSLGLAPIIVRDLFAMLGRLSNETSMAMLIVEQNAQLALKTAHRGYVLESGAISLEGTADELIGRDEVRRAYLGV